MIMPRALRYAILTATLTLAVLAPPSAARAIYIDGLPITDVTFTGHIISMTDPKGYFGGGDLAGLPWFADFNFTVPAGYHEQISGFPGSPFFTVVFGVNANSSQTGALGVGNDNVSFFTLQETSASISAVVDTPISGSHMGISIDTPGGAFQPTHWTPHQLHRQPANRHDQRHCAAPW
jgi:hypothetical protein